MTEFARLHKTLQRQLRRSGIESIDKVPPLIRWQAFLERVSTAYEDDQVAQQLNEHANTLASEEMAALYRDMEQRVADRTRDIELAQAELQATNEELQAQSEELEAQHDQLQATNVELEIKSQDLEAQQLILEQRNEDLSNAKQGLELKADELARASQYKSAFLASMSHELRTPLNSLLILSDILAQNEDANLTADQVKFAKTIHGAGSDLLKLINEILDLAKIESGGISLEIEDITLSSVVEPLKSIFAPVVAARSLQFIVDVTTGAPTNMATDPTKLNQILKNLISNASKFTHDGAILLTVSQVSAGQLDARFADLPTNTEFVSFAVTDTGVGIPVDKQNVIFEAFQQADQGTARKYGGTGLGLAISRELARALGGDIRLRSEPGIGSTFTLLLPREYAGPSKDVPNTPVATPTPSELAAEVDAEAVVPQQRTSDGVRKLLIVEDDPRFAEILDNLARSRGFEPIIAATGKDAIRLAEQNPPDAVTLDLRLPDMDGWAVLDRFHQNQALSHVPVHIISVEEEQERGMLNGAFGYLTKPVSRQDLDTALQSVAAYVDRDVSQLMVVVADDAERATIIEALSADDVEITATTDLDAALTEVRDGDFGCIVLDLTELDAGGFESLAKLRDFDPSLPMIGLTARELTADERQLLHKNVITVIAKGNLALERLVDETSLFLHRVTTKLPAEQEEQLRSSYNNDPSLEGRTILIVDDDPRNVFAIGNVLERHGIEVLNADNGRAGIEALKAHPQLDAVLMDIMMPEMDGYEAMRQIRADDRFSTLPILALTALAMGGDRAKCLEAGASDYITKPIEPTQLLSLLRVWLHQ